MINKSFFGDTQEEQLAYYAFNRILQAAQIKGIAKPTTIYLSHDEELQSFIMWYALRLGLQVKYTNGVSYAD